MTCSRFSGRLVCDILRGSSLNWISWPKLLSDCCFCCTKALLCLDCICFCRRCEESCWFPVVELFKAKQSTKRSAGQWVVPEKRALTWRMILKRVTMVVLRREAYKTSMNFRDLSLNESDPYESSIAKAITVTFFFREAGKPIAFLGLVFWSQEFHLEVPPRNCRAGKRQTSAMQKSTPRKKERCLPSLPSSCEWSQSYFFLGEKCVSFKA